MERLGVSFRTPMLWAVRFTIFASRWAGVTGVVLANAGIDIGYEYLVRHYHTWSPVNVCCR